MLKFRAFSHLTEDKKKKVQVALSRQESQNNTGVVETGISNDKVRDGNLKTFVRCQAKVYLTKFFSLSPPHHPKTREKKTRSFDFAPDNKVETGISTFFFGLCSFFGSFCKWQRIKDINPVELLS
jgi:hypothetical protein